MRFFDQAWASSAVDGGARYQLYLEHIRGSSLPASVKAFVDQAIELHDSNVADTALADDLVLTFRLGDSRFRLTYGGWHLSAKDRAVLERVASDSRYELAYDEFDVDDGFVHRMSFHFLDGLDGEIEIVFERFSFETLGRTRDYAELIHEICRESDVICAVRREVADERVAEFLASVQVISEHETHSWPGTQTFGSAKATLYSFASTPELPATILRFTSEFSDWTRPFLEDLHSYKNDKLVFASIIHEGDYWFEDGRLV